VLNGSSLKTLPARFLYCRR